MKTKIASLLICGLLVISFFAGCNLFETDMPTYLNTIVATAKSDRFNIEITKEQLLNGYYSYGESLIQNGHTVESALDEILKLLMQRELVLTEIKDHAANELSAAKAAAKIKHAQCDDSNYTEFIDDRNFLYELTNEEKNKAVKETWKYINTQFETIWEEFYGTKSDVFTVDEDLKDPEYSPKTEYSQNLAVFYDDIDQVYKAFKYDEKKIWVKSEINPGVFKWQYLISPEFDDEGSELEDNYLPEVLLDKYAYQKPMFNDVKEETKVWNKFIENLKDSQRQKGEKDLSEAAVLKREIDRVLKINIENGYLTKFEEQYTSSFGFTEDGQLLADVQAKILAKYKELYAQNKEEYDLDSASFANGVTGLEDTNGLNTYMYYGESEQYFKVVHILVKFSDEQTAAIENINNDPYLNEDEKEALVNEVKAAGNTYTYARDGEGFEVKTANPLSVIDLYDTILVPLMANIKGECGFGSASWDSEQYAKRMSEEFDKLLYVYNHDTGMINSRFEYVIGTATSPMAEEFTDESRRLFNEEGAGTISSWVETTFGYHFIMYVGDVRSIVSDANDITIDKLNDRTLKLSGGQTYLEYFLESVAQQNYNDYETRLVYGLEQGLKYTYFKDRYKDLF